jgi:hypothetical protein
MTTFLTIATAVGLLAVTLIGLVACGYGLQTLIRLLRHWDTSTPPPALRSGRIAGMEVQLGDATGDIRALVSGLEVRLERLEWSILSLSRRVLSLERKFLRR